MKRHEEVIAAMDARAKIRALTGEANFENQTVMVKPASEIVATTRRRVESAFDVRQLAFESVTGMPEDDYREAFVEYFMWLAEDSVNFEWQGHLDGSDHYVIDSLGLYGLEDDAVRRAILESVDSEFLRRYHSLDGYSYGTCDTSWLGDCVWLAGGALAFGMIEPIFNAAADGAEAVIATNAAGLSSVATNGIEADLALAREHLTGLGPEVIGDPANQAMLASIEDAIAAGRPLTSTELNFLQHELTEAALMAEGVPYTYGEMFNPFAERPPVNAHDMAWIVDGMKPGSNYYGSLFDESYYQWLMGQQ